MTIRAKPISMKHKTKMYHIGQKPVHSIPDRSIKNIIIYSFMLNSLGRLQFLSKSSCLINLLKLLLSVLYTYVFNGTNPHPRLFALLFELYKQNQFLRKILQVNN